MPKKKSQKNEGFEKEKELIELKKELVAFEHKCKMEYLKYIRGTEKLKHEQELERERIKSAEIRKSQMRKYSKDPYKY